MTFLIWYLERGYTWQVWKVPFSSVVSAAENLRDMLVMERVAQEDLLGVQILETGKTPR